MGVIALGIGFATPLALAGVAVHIVGHAVAKALGFYAATPLLGHEPRAAGHAVTGIARTQPGLGATMGISLGTLAGLPPSPLFVSEMLIVAGGFQAGRSWAAAGTAVLLALGFLGLAHALVETTGGRARRRDREVAPGLRPVMALGAASTVILLALAAAAFWLPDTDIVEALARGSGDRPRRPRVPNGARSRSNGRLSRFAGLHASAGGSIVRVALQAPDGALRLETAAVEDGAVPTIVDLAPSLAWDEREAHDLHGVRFDGHEPLRPLVDHDLVLGHWTVPVHGDDAYQVAVGPIHAGVIESGHFRFHVVGDRILHLDARLFYKHRGLERAAEGSTLAEGARYVGRACAACAVANGVAYAHACEESARARADARACARADDPARARTHVEPPQRHRGGVRRGRSRCREHVLRRAHRARTAPQRTPYRPPLPVRCRRRGRKRARARRPVGGGRARGARGDRA